MTDKVKNMINSLKALLSFTETERESFVECSTTADGEFPDPEDKAECERMDYMIDRAKEALRNAGVKV